jgi:hypothetical protein
MFKLTIRSGQFAGTALEFAAGTFHLGRAEENELFVPEPSISSRHCELKASEIGIGVRDLDSTNGTFIKGERITKGVLHKGDILRAGDIEFLAELGEVHIAIPEGAMQVSEELGAAFLEDGTPGCYTHRTVSALFSCTRCENWWCAACVRQMKRLSGDFLIFCPRCGGTCVVLPGLQQAGRKSFFQRVTETLRITPKR